MLAKLLLVGMLAGSAVDIGSTEYALRRPGVYEANPLMRNRGVRVTVNIAVPIAIYRTTKDKSTKTKVLAAVPYIGLKAYLGVHNIKLAKKSP